MKGGALQKYKRRTIDDVAEVMSMFLSGPNPPFGSLARLLGKQAFKGVMDNIKPQH